jgi:DNA-binding transcriptional regulator YhcF (GntR family)
VSVEKSTAKTGCPRGVAERIRLVQEHPTLSSSQKAILGLLGMLYNEAQQSSWASIEFMAYRLSLHTATVKRCLVALKKEGLIERSLRKGDWTKSRKTDIFWDKLHACRMPFESTSKGVEGRASRATATLEEDVAAVQTLDEPAPETTPVPRASARHTRLEVAKESRALL